jgi:tRNA modification GTPase
VRRARAALEGSSIVLAVLDSSSPVTAEDDEVVNACPSESVLILNKCDLPQVADRRGVAEHYGISEQNLIEASGLRGTGLDAIRQGIMSMLVNGGPGVLGDEIIMTNVRHIEAVRGAAAALDRAHQALNEGVPDDLVAADLGEALQFLGEVLGEEISDEILDKIFAEFCIGK